jgi:Tfp pilus assembly protein PilV
MRHKPKIKPRLGITISEVVIASLLLAAATVPVLKALTSAQSVSTSINRKSQSLMLARAKMEDIRAKAIYAYGDSYSASSLVLNGAYLCSVTDTAVSSNLRHITIRAGYDNNADGILNDDEIQVTLDTLIARRL